VRLLIVCERREIIVNRKLIFMLAISALFAVSAGFVASSANAQTKPAKFIKLLYTNKAKVEVNVVTVDHNNNRKSDDNKKTTTPGGQGSSQAMVDSSDHIDVTFSVLGKNAQGVSEYHCKDFKTDVGSKTELTVDVSLDARKC
jgi:hypothetical protein